MRETEAPHAAGVNESRDHLPARRDGPHQS
jgi:hypothetical protein